MPHNPWPGGGTWAATARLQCDHRLAAASGLPPVRLHDLRHGAACLAHAAGADLKTLQQQLGHASIAITADIYTTVLPATQHRAANAAARLILDASASKPKQKTKRKRRTDDHSPVR